MPSQYRLTVDESGYHFRTDSGIKYTAFFTNYSLYDSDGNEHIVYSFGFERDGSYAAKKFEFRYDYKIKNTIIKLIGDFFDRHGENALLYFCYPMMLMPGIEVLRLLGGAMRQIVILNINVARLIMRTGHYTVGFS